MPKQQHQQRHQASSKVFLVVYEEVGVWCASIAYQVCMQGKTGAKAN